MTRRPARTDAPTVFLVDGWGSYRRSLRLLLEASGYRVVGEADTVAGVRDADVVVLEPARGWPELEGELRTVRSSAPRAGIVLLSSAPLRAQLVFRAVESGVRACLTKRDEPADFLRAIEAAVSTEFILLPRHLLAKTAAHLAHATTSRIGDPALHG